MKPILFNIEMVRAILDGRKTVTRRVAKPQPGKDAHSPYKCCGWRFAFRIADRACTEQYKPPYQPGDILYVRETWSPVHVLPKRYLYKADADSGKGEGAGLPIKWCPSIHMPREAARIFLRVTDVRVERLQDITTEQAMRESCQGEFSGNGESMGSGWKVTPEEEFANLWDSTIKPAGRALYGWNFNPWVWVIEFDLISREEAMDADR